MDQIKIFTGIAISFFLLLFILVLFVKNPEKQRFEEAVQSIMIREGLTYQEVLAYHPELKQVESHLKRIDYLNKIIYNKTAGPAPNVSGQAGNQLTKYSKEIRLLRKTIDEQLSKHSSFHFKTTASHANGK